ncbi:MAG TPA: transporter substrate-binding domain-containing protein [Candidatus Galloscillospira excrementavium]|nr:transporter substrate-binding domain-containing protein [Candidatus Galloscillospira excrementavium]
MNTKKLGALALALLLTLSLAACGDSAGGDTATPTPAPGTQAPDAQTTESPAAESDVAYIQNKGTLVVGITEFAPMDYQDENGEWIGFDADLARKVADALGVEVEFSLIEWGSKLMELDSKTVDCLWNGMTITDEITNGASATNAYATNAQVVVLKADVAEEYQTVESLAGLNFAVEAGSAGEAAAQEAGLTHVSVSDQATALMEVSSGTSDACIVDLLMAGAMIGEGTSYPDLTFTVRLAEEEYGVGCRKGSDLAEFINEQLKALYDDGTITALAEQYGIADNIIPQE